MTNKDKIPTSFKDAIERIVPLIKAVDAGTLKNVDNQTFLKGWAAIAFLFSGLHPDSTTKGNALARCDHKKELTPVEALAMRIEPRLIGPYYVKTGWPCILNPILNEAWERPIEIYQCEAQIAGIENQVIE